MAASLPSGSTRTFGSLLNYYRINYRLVGGSISTMAASRPLVVVSNHPYGVADGLVLISLLEQSGRPFRVLINEEFLKLPHTKEIGLPVSFRRDDIAKARNFKTMREAERFLKRGGIILIFPAGGVATAKYVLGRTKELPWKEFVATLAVRSEATVLPVYVHGQNSLLFQLVSLPIHFAGCGVRPLEQLSELSIRCRMGLFVPEFGRMLNQTLDLSIGKPLEADHYMQCGNPESIVPLR